MADEYHVRVEKERLTFCEAHFITYADDVCEPIHGHNYHVYAEVHGPLGPNAYVVDFIALRDILQGIVDSLDHRVLLPTQHPTIRVSEQSEDGPEVLARHGKRRWIFPRQDCVLLALTNTTAELLARYIADRLISGLGEALMAAVSRLEVGVDECDGQWGVYRWIK